METENQVSPANAFESITRCRIKALLDDIELYTGNPILFNEIAGSLFHAT
jgi:hypothetical protein